MITTIVVLFVDQITVIGMKCVYKHQDVGFCTVWLMGRHYNYLKMKLVNGILSLPDIVCIPLSTTCEIIWGQIISFFRQQNVECYSSPP